MKKIGLIALAIVLSLGLVGAGFAYWTETLTIDADVETGEVDAIFRQAVSNDDGSVTPKFCINGWWMGDIDTGDNGDDPEACQTMGDPVSRTLNVARTTVSGAWPDGGVYGSVPPLPANPDDWKELTVTMSGVYPSYYATVFFSIVNAGTIPCQVKSIKLAKVSKGGVTSGTPDFELVVCQTVYIDADAGTVSTTLDPNVHDFSLHLSDDEESLYDVMGVYAQPVDTAAGDLGIHVEEGAEENTTYDFTIRITVSQV